MAEYRIWRYAINKIEKDGRITPLLMVWTEEEANKYRDRADLMIKPVYEKVEDEDSSG